MRIAKIQKYIWVYIWTECSDKKSNVAGVHDKWESYIFYFLIHTRLRVVKFSLSIFILQEENFI